MTTYIHRRAMLGASAATAALAAASAVRADDAPAPSASATPSAAAPIEIYAAPPFVDEIALSPDGKRVAMVTQRGDQKLLIYFEVADQTPKMLTIGATKIRNLFWGDNDHVVFVTSQTVALPGFAGNKHEFLLVSTYSLTTGKITTLFSREEGFYNIVMGDVHRIKVNGEYRLTASNWRMAQSGGGLCLFSFGFDASRGHLIYEGSESTEGFIVGPDGYCAAYSDFERDRKTWTLYYNKAPAGKSPIFKAIYKVKEALDFPSLVGLGRDGQSVVVLINKGEAAGEHHEISIDGVLSPPLDPDAGKGMGSDAIFHPTTFRLAGFARHDDWFSYDYNDPLLKKLNDALPVIMGDEYRSYVAAYGEDPRKMIIYGESASDAGSYYFADLSNGDLIPISSNYSGIPEEWITQKKAISYKAADGLAIHAYLTLPPFKGDKKLPLIVLPHGGPEARDYIDFDWQTQVLASRGYAVLQPNFRGSGGYTTEFSDAGHGELGRKMQTDLSDGVRYLAGLGTIDPKRVAILGASYGGYAALAGATLDAGVYNSAVAIAGFSNLKSMIDFEIANHVDRNSPAVQYWLRYFGDKERYDDVSPDRQAAKAYCPILLIHGTDDTVVPIDQSRRMEKALKAAGKPVEFVTYKGQDHWETIGSARIEMMKAAMAFLEKHNPPA